MNERTPDQNTKGSYSKDELMPINTIPTLVLQKEIFSYFQTGVCCKRAPLVLLYFDSLKRDMWPRPRLVHQAVFGFLICCAYRFCFLSRNDASFLFLQDPSRNAFIWLVASYRNVKWPFTLS